MECALAIDSVFLDSVQRYVAVTLYDTADLSASEVSDSLGKFSDNTADYFCRVLNQTWTQ